MAQALHIFRKDVRALRPYIGVVMAVLAAFTWAHVRADLTTRVTYDTRWMVAWYSGILLVVAWCALVSQLIHEEALPGDRQFWLTRPYSWRQLLLAKILFVAAFVNAPLFAVQILLLAVSGFSPVDALPKLPWLQLAAILLLLAPAFALSALTRSLAQFVLAVLAAFVLFFYGLSAFFNIDLSGGAWLNNGVALVILFLGAVPIVIAQYARRSTVVSAAAGLLTAGAAVAACAGIPPTVQASVQTRMIRAPETRNIRAFVADSTWVALAWNSSGPLIRVDIPITFANVPEGEYASAAMVNITIDAPSGMHWTSGWEQQGNAPFLRLVLPANEYSRLRNSLATVRGSMYVVVSKQRTAPLLRGTVLRASGATCQVAPADEDWVFCKSAFYPPYELISEPASRSPWPAQFSLDPVFTAVSHDESFMVEKETRAWIRSDFVAHNVRFPL